MFTYIARCHCGNLALELSTDRPAAELPVRACQCSFCRAHGALSTSDPAGRARLRVLDPAALARYRFGQRTAEFLVCRDCGVYVGSVIEDGGAAWTVLNVNAMAERAQFGTPTPMSYDGETVEQRTARRRARWTPVAP